MKSEACKVNKKINRSFILYGIVIGIMVVSELDIIVKLTGILAISIIEVLIIRNSKLLYQINIDSLTQLPNWNSFIKMATREVKKNQVKNYALVSFDILQFRSINNVFGHKVGDEILYHVARKVETLLCQGECFTRYSFDQFDAFVTYEDQEGLKERILQMDKQLSCVFPKRKLQFYYGVYLLQEEGESIVKACDYASSARCDIKGKHDTHISFFNNALREKLIGIEEIESKMEKALQENEFVVYYQPKYGLHKHNIVGAEALIRWKTKEEGLISPGEFIPIFEKNGFIIPIDYYVLEEVCKKLKGWIEKGITPISISVNLSRVHLHTPDLAQILKGIVDRYELEYGLIELELTETAFFEDKQILINTIKQLHAIGFGISMDDFGSGYSSLNLLKDLELDIIKLDGELFRSTEDAKRCNIIIKNTIEMVKRLDMKIIAEGVETKEQVEFLHANGCDFVQGFYFAKPMRSDQLDCILYKENNMEYEMVDSVLV